MAVQIETRGQLQDFLDILRRRKWQVLLPAAFVIALGSAFAVLVPKKYVVRTQVELRPVGVSVSSKDGANATFQIRSRERVKKVVQDLKNQEYLTLPPEERNAFLMDIVSDVKVRLDRAGDNVTTFVNMEYASVDPLWARTFLRALREDWIQDVIDRDRNKLRDEKEKLFEAKQKLERELKRQEEEVTELKRKHNLSATQPTPGGDGLRGEDPIYARLQANKGAASDLESAIAKQDVQIGLLEKSYAEMPEMVAGDQQVVAGSSNDTELRALDEQILDMRHQIDAYRPEHTKFKKLSRELEDLLDKREQLAHIVQRSEVVTTSKPNPEREPLLKRIEALKFDRATNVSSLEQLKKRIADDERTHQELQQVYEDLRVKNTTIANLRASLAATDISYTATAQRFDLVDGPTGNPFSITEEVVPPPKPTEPNPWLIVSFSILAGLGLGIALAVLLEYSKNCFRSVHELSRVLVVPVLGSVNRIVTRRELRLLAARRILVGVSSVLLLGSVAFVTWAWAKSPELLSPNVREKIEVFRSRFR